MHSWKSWGILEVSLIQQLDEETREEQSSTTSLRQPTGGRFHFGEEKAKTGISLFQTSDCGTGHVPGAHSCVKLC